MRPCVGSILIRDLWFTVANFFKVLNFVKKIVQIRLWHKTLSYRGHMQRVPKMTLLVFSQNFVKSAPTFTMFGKQSAKTIKLCQVHSLSISRNLSTQSVQKADAPNCYITRWLGLSVSDDCSLFIFNLTDSAMWCNNLLVLNILRWKQQTTK